MAVGPAFARVLAAGRAQFNARVTETRRRYPAFDNAAFAAFLETGVDPVVDAVAGVAPDRAASTALAAFDIALDLVGQGLAGPGARQPLVGVVWSDVLPAYARLVAEDPAAPMGMLTNAAVNLGKTDGVRPQEWIAGLRALGPRVATLAQLRALGQVLAWRCGMAHLRLGAIAAAGGLPEELALAALGCTDALAWPQVRERLLANPWWQPDGAPHPGIEVGRFTGFGGAFARPPAVRPCVDGFIVQCNDRYSLLVADASGAVLHAATRDEFDGAAASRFEGAVACHGERLRIGGREILLDLPADGLAVTHNAHTVAVTSAFSHAIRLLPLK